MKFRTVLVAFILFPFFLMAQDQSPGPKEKKSEIGLNISPLLAGLAGGFQDEPTLNLRYKTGGKYKFRAIAQTQFITAESWPTTSSIERITDSSMFFSNNDFNNGGNYDLRFGVERQYQNGKWGWYWGTDLLFGYHEEYTNFSYYERLYTTDSLGNIEFLTPNYDSAYTFPPNDYHTNTDTYNWYTGLAASFGLYYDIGSSWRLTAELPVRYFVAFGGKTTTYTIDNNTNDIVEDVQKNNETTHNFNVEFINFLVSYKF